MPDYPPPAVVYDEIVIADSTRRTYEPCWRSFCLWCRKRGRKPLPAAPSTIADYLNHLATIGRAAATIAKHRAAIATAHRMQEHQPAASGIVRNEWSRIKRRIGTAQTRKRSLSVEEIRRICETLPDTLAGKRDRAVILLGFASACRRSELAALDVADLDWVTEGIAVKIRRSKTDQEGRTIRKGIPRGLHPVTCPVRAVQEWITAAGISDGPLFREIRDGCAGRRLRGEEIAAIVKAAARSIGLEPRLYAGHSLRRGFVTAADRRRIPRDKIRRQTGHRDMKMIDIYIEEDSLFVDNPAGMVGL